jgi:hypothetical protein
LHPEKKIMNMVEEIERRALEELGKRQFKMYLPDELDDQLAMAADKHGRGSSQQVVEEVLTIFLPAWSAMQAAMRRAVDYQLQHLSGPEILAASGKVVLLESKGQVVDVPRPRKRKTG